MICFDYIAGFNTYIEKQDIKAAWPVNDTYYMIENVDGLIFQITALDYMNIINDKVPASMV